MRIGRFARILLQLMHARFEKLFNQRILSCLFISTITDRASRFLRTRDYTHGSIIQALINPPIIEQRFIPSRWINWRVFTRKRLSCRAFIAVHKFVHTGRDVTRWQKWTDALNTNEYRWIGFSSPSCYPGNPINSAPYDTISNRSSPTGFSKPDRLYKSFDLTLLCLTRIETYESNAPSQWLFKYQQQYSRYGIITIE